MIVSPAFAGKRYAVLGLARSGLAAVASLHAGGARVTAWDRRPGPRDEVSAIAAIGDPMEIELAGYDGVVVSPGVPLNTHPIAQRARQAGVPVIGDVELFALARASLPPHKVVGITGTNGKSTTTALVHHILANAGVPSRMGGNIGLPILAQEPLPRGGVYVLELSSYQIDLTQSLDCDVAVLTNVTPDHLDRYEDFAAYRASKLRLFGMQSNNHAAVYDLDGPEAEEIARLTGGDAARDGFTADQVGLMAHHSEWPALQGPHNRQNAAAAIKACQALGLTYEDIARGLATFAGLPHRMERVATHNGVLFVNDSKATNPASTAPALAAYPRTHWIVGGLPKGEGLDECAPHFGNVAAAYTIGEAGPAFAELLEPHMHVERSELLCEAVRRAAAAAKPGETVLLSPACASFDQFTDYEARGDAFRKIVAQLTGGVTAAPGDFTARSAA